MVLPRTPLEYLWFTRIRIPGEINKGGKAHVCRRALPAHLENTRLVLTLKHIHSKTIRDVGHLKYDLLTILRLFLIRGRAKFEFRNDAV